MSETRTVSAAQAKKAILAAFKNQRPAFLWGPPGIGKSEVVAQVTRELGGHMIDLRLSQIEPTELIGIPFYNKDTGKMDWAPPVQMPDEELASKYPIVVMLFDELNTGSPAIQSASYQLFLDRRIGKFPLPDNVVTIAAGNRENDKGVTYRMPSPLSNRFVHLEMRPDFDSWEAWAISAGIHKDVIAYLTFSKKDLYDFDSRSASRAFATPRSWKFTSDFLHDDSIDEDTLINLISGTIGEGLALKFMAYRKMSDKLPNAVDVLNGTVTTLETSEISAQYSLVVSMCYEMKQSYDSDRKLFGTQFNNFLTFSMANFETELVIMASRLALKTHEFDIRNSVDPKIFKEFTDRYGKYIQKVNDTGGKGR